MKKLLYLFCASLLVLTSCSSDDNSSDSSSSILPKTIKYSYPSSPEDDYSTTIVYNGDKIVSLKNEYFRQDYTYDGNLIVKTTSYSIVSGKDVKNFEGSYTYANNKLATDSYAEEFSAEFPAGQYRGRSVYIYNSDGTVKRESYYTNSSGVETKSSYGTVSTYVNGNIVKEVNSAEGSNNSDTDVYEYDSKNNPLKNITGFNLLLLHVEITSVNNVIKHTSSSVFGSSTSGPDVYKTEYVYNANGYPTKMTSYKKDGTTVEEIIEYTY